MMLLTILVSCNTQENVKPAKSVVRVENGRMVFKNEEVFNKVLQGEIEKPAFESGSLKKASADTSLANVPSELLAILDENQLFETEEYIFKLNFSTRKVYVLRKSNEAVYGEMLLNEIPHDSVYHYNMESDVFSLLEEGYRNDLMLKKFIFCGDGVARSRTTAQDDIPLFFANPLTRVVATSQYQKYGVWFRFNSQVDILVDGLSVNSWLVTDRNIVYEYEQNCRNGKSRNGTVTGSDTANSASGSGGSILTSKHTVYESTRGLQRTFMQSSYILRDINGRLVTITTPAIDE